MGGFADPSICSRSRNAVYRRRWAPIGQYVLVIGRAPAWLAAVMATALVVARCGGGNSAKGLNQAAERLPPDEATTAVLPDLQVRVAPDGRSWSTGAVEGARLVVLRQWFGQARTQAIQNGADFVFSAEARVATLPTDVSEAAWAKGHVPGQQQIALSAPSGAPTDLVESFDPAVDQYQGSFFSDHVDYWMELIANRSPQHDTDFNRLLKNWLLQLHVTLASRMNRCGLGARQNDPSGVDSEP